jgi:hypothetical protein
MRTELHDHVRNWMGAEESGHDDAADRGFARVAAGWPRRQASPDFARQVFRKIGLPAPVSDVWAAWWMRALTAGALGLAGLFALSVSPAAWVVAWLSSVGAAAVALERTWTAIGVWMGAVVAVWSGVAHAALVVGRLMAAPGPLMLLAVNLTVAACAFAALRRLLVSQET